MIRVTFEQIEDGKTMLLKVEGHSGYDDIGKDIVCSAASILAYTVAQAVTNLEQRKMLKKRPTLRLKEGDAVIICKPSKGGFAEAMYAYHFAQMGYALLAHNYPDFVRVKLFGGGDAADDK